MGLVKKIAGRAQTSRFGSDPTRPDVVSHAGGSGTVAARAKWWLFGRDWGDE